MVNSLENNLLQTYDPYATPDGAGDIDKAKEEIARPEYDTDGDGVCDAPECKDMLTISDTRIPTRSSWRCCSSPRADWGSR